MDFIRTLSGSASVVTANEARNCEIVVAQPSPAYHQYHQGHAIWPRGRRKTVIVGQYISSAGHVCLTFDAMGKKLMSKKAAEHHKKASEHFTQAARHHGEAAKHHEAGNHERAAHHIEIAHAHVLHAREHADEARKAYAVDHGGFAQS